APPSEIPSLGRVACSKGDSERRGGLMAGMLWGPPAARGAASVRAWLFPNGVGLSSHRITYPCALLRLSTHRGDSVISRRVPTAYELLEATPSIFVWCNWSSRRPAQNLLHVCGFAHSQVNLGGLEQRFRVK